jgi:hypothetical protein
MRRGTFLAEEVLMSQHARRGSLFASIVKHDDPVEAPGIAKMHLFAAVMFVLGSLFFVYQEVSQHWLIHYRIGCVLFIIGCTTYLVAMGMSGAILDEGLSSRVSDSIIIVAMVLFIVGCAIPFRGDEEEVLKRFDLMNWLFLVGSILLLLDAVKCAISSRFTEGLTLGNYLDLSTTVCFLFGAILGGKFYKDAPVFVEEGMFMWLFGSCFCAIGPTRVLAWDAYDPSTFPRKGDENLYGTLQATLDGRDRGESESLAYLRSASLPSNYHSGAGNDSSDDGIASSSEEAASSDNQREPRAFP